MGQRRSAWPSWCGWRGALTVECGFQQGKGETGLDHYQLRRYDAWYRHVTFSMLAQAFLAVMRARAAGG
jgi:SRSO17 transposase